MRAAALALVSVLLAGCSGGDEESAPVPTATRTVTVSEPALAETAPDAGGSLADVV